VKTEVKDLFDKLGSIFTILAIIGISQIGNVSKWLKKFFINTLLKLLGYPKERINNEKNGI
jgi:hypothetical protein